jgi:non-ribosomal peptide synthase protein (TIGR01720 family)
MVPAEYVSLDRLPRTATGKIDRVKLRTELAPETRFDSRADRAPASEEEKTLLEVWQELFARDDISLTDNFFQMGGDSMLTIQMTSLSRHRGVSIRPQDIFEYPTIELLAARANGEVVTDATQSIEVGASKLLPIHHWFIENQAGFPDHWNMSRLIPISASARSKDVQAVLLYVINHHDALRSRIFEDDGDWKLSIDSRSKEVALEIVNVVDSTAVERGDRISECEVRMHSAIRLSTGECIRFALILTEPSRPNLLLAVAHHAVVDIVSWGIIEQDVETLLSYLEEGREMSLPRRTTSVRKWAEVLRFHANTALVKNEVSFWERQATGQRIPRDFDRDRPNLHRDAVSTRVAANLDVSELTGFRPVVDIRPNELVLYAISRSLAEWMRESTVAVGIESAGRRQTLDPDVDLSRTVGWLTAAYTLDVKATSAAPETTLEAASRIAGQLRSVPGHGLGFGMLRYLAPDVAVRERLEPQSQPEIIFNYLGTMRRDPAREPTEDVRPSAEIARSGATVRPALLEILAFADAGKLVLDWRYNLTVHRSETIEGLAKRAAVLIEQFAEECRDRLDAASTDPIAGANISREDLDSLLRSLG